MQPIGNSSAQSANNTGLQLIGSNGSVIDGQKKQQPAKASLWLKCNDSSISRIDKADIISKDAYILFYKRKEFSASNIINYTSGAAF
jgi:ubiquitin C-terminal hydrolase